MYVQEFHIRITLGYKYRTDGAEESMWKDAVLWQTFISTKTQLTLIWDIIIQRHNSILSTTDPLVQLESKNRSMTITIERLQKETEP